MLFDTHAHVNFRAYKDDAKDVIRRALAGGVFMINVGSQYSTSERAVQMAQEYQEGVYASVGLHPIHLAAGIFKTKVDSEEISFETREEEFNSEKYRALAQMPKVVAIGEIGLDYYYKPKTKIKLEQFKQKQKEAFQKQLDLAKELSLPVILHCRMAHREMLDILKEKIKEFSFQGVVHCFTGTIEDAKEYFDLGFYLGFNGIIFKLNLNEVIKEAPLDRILLETDCPYLTPAPITGRNEPSYVKYVAGKVAQLKNLSSLEIEKITTQNAKKLFRI